MQHQQQSDAERDRAEAFRPPYVFVLCFKIQLTQTNPRDALHHAHTKVDAQCNKLATVVGRLLTVLNCDLEFLHVC